MIIGVHDFVGEDSLLLVFFELSHLNKEVAYVFDEMLETGKGDVLRIGQELGQE